MKLNSFAVCVMVMLPSSLWAQDTPGGGVQPPAKAVAAASGSQRPRIALVLEGGGALGLAHVGVIKWLEENRSPVDVVAGTSMGALVGGIYASGESPDQISALIRSINWSEVLTGVTPDNDLSFRRKEDRGLKKGTQFPSGFNSGQQVGLILDRVGLPYSGRGVTLGGVRQARI
jgi:NTE family protein